MGELQQELDDARQEIAALKSAMAEGVAVYERRQELAVQNAARLMETRDALIDALLPLFEYATRLIKAPGPDNETWGVTITREEYLAVRAALAQAGIPVEEGWNG